MFTREDWTLFRNLGTLCQKAGVPKSRLRRLVVKELADNALDALPPGGKVTFGQVGEDTYWVRDTGDGIPGTGEEIASLFSIRRPLTSTKVLRLPVRGALGNGLRVVAGAVLATGGTLSVSTRGRKYRLRPQDDGTTAIEDTFEWDSPGTLVEINLGPGLPADENALAWANQAAQFQDAKRYAGKTSAWWYDSDSFHDLLQAAGDRTLHELISQFDGYGGAKGEIAPERAWLGSTMRMPEKCSAVNRESATSLLAVLRKGKANVKPNRIGSIDLSAKGGGYKKATGILTVDSGRGGLSAELPYVVEVWAYPQEGADAVDSVTAYINGTPITGSINVERQPGNKLAFFGCGLKNYCGGAPKKKAAIEFNVTIPYMPITTDGKEPDFRPLLAVLSAAVAGAVRQFKKFVRKQENRPSQTAAIVGGIDDGIAKASGNGEYRYSLRQLYYAIRPVVLAADPDKGTLDYNHFSKVVGDYEAANGPLAGMYRDPRGTLYHPHLREEIPLGTLAIESYQRPELTFNKVLYCEKEGLIHLLRSVQWPERNDCALLSSKGFASRAVRDVLDLIGDTDEEITFYCIHDADASGTLIYETLQGATVARGARKVRIENLGLDPWAAVRMGLAVEEFEVKGDRRLPVARYIKDMDCNPGGTFPPRSSGCRSWEDWFQGRRIELNAMTSPQFLAWLDEQFEDTGPVKIIPKPSVLRGQLLKEADAVVRRRVTADILAANDFSGRVQAEMDRVRDRIDPATLPQSVEDALAVEPAQRWDAPLRTLAERLAAPTANGTVEMPGERPDGGVKA